MKLRVCRKCGQPFIGPSYDGVCDICKLPRTAHIGKCDIVETFGRCEPFLRGECKLCLDYCAIHNWRGWKREGEVPCQFDSGLLALIKTYVDMEPIA